MANKKFNILISKENSPPYYIEIPSWVKTFVLYVFPSLLLLFFLILIFNINLIKFGKIVPNAKINNQREKLILENKKLTSDVQELEISNQKLRAKILSFDKLPPSDSESFQFNFIKLPQTFKDLTDANMVSISRWQWDYSNNKVQISFQINNETKDKIRGYLFIIQYSQDSYQIFPAPSHPEILLQKSYLEGHSFNISYFKPIDASFKLFDSSSSVRYQLIMLSVDGDLLFTKNFGPYSPK